MSFIDFPYEVEQIKVDSKGIQGIRINVIVGQDNDGYFICQSPSLQVSGYGDNETEARKSFDENIRLFQEDMAALSNKKRLEYLHSLGWIKHKLFNKQYSKVFVDAEGILQGLNEPQVNAVEKELAA